MLRRAQTETNISPLTKARQNILIVKLGAFGNIILSLAAFAAIRKHHAGARISVLTQSTYSDWLWTFPYFDEVLVDPRPAWWDLPTARRLSRMLSNGHFDRVYDLQTSTRSSRYFSLFPATHRPEWSGIAFGCSHPDRDPRRNVLHDTVRQQGQLRQAGIFEIPPADLSWCSGDIARFNLPADFALLVPGGSAGPIGQALAGSTLSGAGATTCRTWDRLGHRGRGRGEGIGGTHPSRDRSDRPDRLWRPM